MSRVIKTTAYTGAVLALALTLTGCNGGGQPSNNSTSASASQSSLEPIQDVSSSASASSSSASASSSSAASSGSEVGKFTPVTSKAPESEKEGKAKAFEVVQLHYKVQTALVQSQDPAQVDNLSVAVAGPYLEQEKAAFKKAFESTPQTYEGESKPELISAIAGPLVAPDGGLTDYSSVTLKVCEDNSGVKVTDQQGKPVNTGMPRYVVDYSARWFPETGEWKVTSRTLPQKEETC